MKERERLKQAENNIIIILKLEFKSESRRKIEIQTDFKCDIYDNICSFCFCTCLAVDGSS